MADCGWRMADGRRDGTSFFVSSVLCHLPSALCHPLPEVRHLDRRQRGFPPFVFRSRPRALDGLLVGVAGDDAEGDGELRVAGDAREIVRHLRGNEIEMRRVAAQET